MIWLLDRFGLGFLRDLWFPYIWGVAALCLEWIVLVGLFWCVVFAILALGWLGFCFSGW